MVGNGPGRVMVPLPWVCWGGTAVALQGCVAFAFPRDKWGTVPSAGNDTGSCWDMISGFGKAPEFCQVS